MIRLTAFVAVLILAGALAERNLARRSYRCPFCDHTPFATAERRDHHIDRCHRE